MRILIFGATGMLGKDLMSAFPGHEVTGLGSKDADLRDARKVLQVTQQARPQSVILAAAYTDVDGCEKNPEQAFAVNRDGAAHVAQAASQTGAHFCLISSDYVFDGKKRTPYETDDPRNPVNVYGQSKAEAETQVRQIVPGCCIVRTSWLFGLGGRCFPDTMLRLAKSQPELRVVDDQRGCPTFTQDLARALGGLVDREVKGIVHATNRGSTTWFEFARAILAARNLKSSLLPVSTAQAPRRAKRPAYSVLSSQSMHALGVELPEWQDALARYLKQRND